MHTCARTTHQPGRLRAESTSAKGLKFWARLFRAIQARQRYISNRIVRDRRRFVPAPGVDIVEQLLDDITGGGGDLHRQSSSSICAIKQLANCSDPGSVLRF